jgi:hypothetical protein
MVEKPAVFISSTGDLRSARDLVAKVLISMGYDPVWQDIEPTDGGELLDVLRKRMEPCALMIPLVGTRYGAEPPLNLRLASPPTAFGRVSYTQFEAKHFEKLGRKVIYLFLDASFPTDPAKPEALELTALQAAYRDQITANNCLRQTVTTNDSLKLAIREMRDELAEHRRLAEERYREVTKKLDGIAQDNDQAKARDRKVLARVTAGQAVKTGTAVKTGGQNRDGSNSSVIGPVPVSRSQFFSNWTCPGFTVLVPVSRSCPGFTVPRFHGPVPVSRSRKIQGSLFWSYLLVLDLNSLML